MTTAQNRVRSGIDAGDLGRARIFTARANAQTPGCPEEREPEDRRSARTPSAISDRFTGTAQRRHLARRAGLSEYQHQAVGRAAQRDDVESGARDDLIDAQACRREGRESPRAAPPATTPAAAPAADSRVAALTTTEKNAPAIRIPSSPMLTTPERSESTPPSAA